MNKNRYRIIFSKAKNMFIAVAENIKSQSKATGQSRVKNVTSRPDNNGVWEGTAEIFDSASNTWVLKGGNQGKSTFFPSGWTKEKLQFELTEVLKKRQSSGFVSRNQAFEAISPAGVRIKFVPPPLNHPTIKQWCAWPIK